MVQNVIQIKSEIKITADVNVKIQWSIMYTKLILFGILVYMSDKLWKVIIKI